MSEPTPSADHSVKVTHLVFGLLFLGIAGLWALVTGDVVTADRLTYIGPGLLIAAGVIGLAASLASARNRRNRIHGENTTPDHHDGDDITEELR